MTEHYNQFPNLTSLKEFKEDEKQVCFALNQLPTLSLIIYILSIN